MEEYGSLEVKMAVTGQGNADKAQVRVALERFHGLKGLPDQPDAVDAAAIALCHLTQARLRKVAAPMISFLEGDVAERSGTRVVISVGGVGYDVQVPASTLAKLPPVGPPRPRVHAPGRPRRRDDAVRVRATRTSASCSTCS